MNKFPLVEMLAYFSRYQRLDIPAWRKPYLHHMKRVRSCHSKTDGGVKHSYYSVETRRGDIVNLAFNEEELLWSLEPVGLYADYGLDRVLALIKRHKHTPSRAHRIVPYRFEILPKKLINRPDSTTEISLLHRMQPYRFKTGKIVSTQVTKIITRHLENVMITKHLHYVVETDTRRFFHLVYILDQSDWRLMQEVDEQFFFVR